MKKNVACSIAAAASLLTFAVYLASLRNEFVEWDDSEYVFQNPHIRVFDLDFLRWAFLDFHAANWHPLTWISHALDYAAWGLNPLGHHLTNNILHAANTFLVVVLAVRLLEAARASRFTPIAAGATGLLFGLHPVHVESVAWVAERKDLLCALFFLLSVISYSQYASWARSRPAGERDKAWGRYFTTLLFFALALLSKPMAVTLPFVLLIMDWHPFGRITSRQTFRSALLEKLPFFALSVVSAALTIRAQDASKAIRSTQIVPLVSRMLVAADSLVMYLWKMLLPINLSPYYPYPKDASLSSARYLSAIVLVVAITVVCGVVAKKHRSWLAVWMFYVTTLVPVLGFVHVGRQAMADRYLYLPAIGPFLVVGVLLAGLWERARRLTPASRYLGAAAAGVLLLSISLLTLKQIEVWKNSLSLWTCVIEKEPSKVTLAYNNRGIAFGRRNQLENAIEDFTTAIALDPIDSQPFYNRGLAYGKMGQYDKAFADYSKAISLNPSFSNAYYNRGLLFERAGRLDQAISDLEKTIALQPAHREGRMRLEVLYGTSGYSRRR